MAIKVYSPTDFEDTSSGVSIDGNLVVDTSVLYVDTANNRVGIGTTNPLYPLAVESSTSGLISRIYNTNVDGQGLLIRAGSTASATRVLQLASENDTKIMTVNSNGKVGIGTASPESLLHLESSTSTDPDLRIVNTNNDDKSGEIRFVKKPADGALTAGDELGELSFLGSATDATVRLGAHIRSLVEAQGGGYVNG